MLTEELRQILKLTISLTRQLLAKKFECVPYHVYMLRYIYEQRNKIITTYDSLMGVRSSILTKWEKKEN